MFKEEGGVSFWMVMFTVSLEHDFPLAGHRVGNPAALRRWLTAYAAAVSTTASYESIRGAATFG